MKTTNIFYSEGLSSIFLIFLCIIFLLVPREAVSATICDKYYEKAMKLWLNKKMKEAEQVFSLGIRKCPNDAKLYFQRAKIRQEYFNNCDDAILDYTTVLKLNPNTKIGHAKSYYKRGLCWYKFGRYELAVRDFSGCLKVNPRYDGRVRIARAKAYAKLGMIKNAVNDLKNCSKFDPKYGQGARAKKIQSLLKEILSGKMNSN